MFLSFLLLAQLFTPLPEQVSASPVEVLDVEVVMEELKARSRLNPRDQKPPGAVGSQRFPGVREPIRENQEQPTIEERSVELGKVSRRSASEPVLTRSTDGYIYEYRVRVKNNSPKKIKSIIWEYQLTDGSSTTPRVFLCTMTIKPGSVKQLAARTPSPPNRVVSAGASKDDSQTQQAIVNHIEFSDGSTWTREGWKQDPEASSKSRNIVGNQCTML